MARKTLTDRLLRTLTVDTADAVVPGLAVRIGAACRSVFNNPPEEWLAFIEPA